MSKQSPAAFPNRLKLNPFERYMLVDDHPALPMVIRVRVEVNSRIDRGQLARALDATLQSHPLLRSIVVQQQHVPCWEEVLPESDHSKSILKDYQSEQPVTQLNLCDSTGLRVQLINTETNVGSSIVFDFHHSCCDGLGAIRFVEQLAECYSADCKKQDVAPKRVELSQLRAESRVWKRFGKFLLRLPQETIGALALIEYFSHSPISLKQLAQAGESCEPASQVVANASGYASAENTDLNTDRNQIADLQTVVSDEDFQQVRQTLKARKSTVNDHFVASVFAGVDAWRESYDRRPPPAGHLRILIPMNMRDRNSDPQSSVNEVSMIYLDRRPWKHKSFNRLAASVRLEMGAVKKLRLGRTFQSLLEFMIRSRIGLRKLLPTDRCIGTTLASNLGVILSEKAKEPGDSIAFGESNIEAIEVVPPIRPHTQASFLCYTFGSQFYICMTYNAGEISQQLAASLLEQVTLQFSST